MFQEYSEEYVSSKNSKSVKRNANPLDSFVSLEQIFKDSPYKVSDLGEMTQLQYRVLFLMKMETNVRANNDHEAMSGNTAQTTTNTKGKKSIVGH